MNPDRRTSPTVRRRVALTAAGVGVVPLGLAARYFLPASVGDVAGGALYAVLIYLLVAFVAPRWRPAALGAAALAICCAVEFFQLTPVPSTLAEWFPPIALVLGSSFVGTDLLAYAAGASIAGLIDAVLVGAGLRRRRSGDHGEH